MDVGAFVRNASVYHVYPVNRTTGESITDGECNRNKRTAEFSKRGGAGRGVQASYITPHSNP